MKFITDKNEALVGIADAKNYGNALLYCSEELRNDREVVVQAVKHNPLYLAFVSDEFKNDREVVVQAVKQLEGYALQYASKELQNDAEIRQIAGLDE